MNQRNKIILAVSLFAGGILSIFASSFPDGLERVAEDKGFIGAGVSLISGIIPDYAMPGITYEPLAVALAGIFGTIFTFIIIFVLGRLFIKFSIRVEWRKYFSF